MGKSELMSTQGNFLAPEVGVRLNVGEKSEARVNTTMKEEVIKVPELYFQPRLYGKMRTKPLPQVVVDAVRACDPHVRRHLCRNIYLAGQGSLFPGLRERLTAELACSLPPSYDIKVSDVEGHTENMSAYLGGVKLARSSAFERMCLTKKEFNDPDDIGIASAHMLE